MKEHTTKSGITRTTLSPREKFRLTNFIMDEYKKFELPDTEFCALVKEKLELSVTECHIANIRREFEIPANYKRGAQPQTSASNVFRTEVARRLEQLEAQVSTLLRERHENHYKGVK